MKVYLSGAITGINEADVRKAFAVAEAEMVSCNHDVVSPLDNGLDYAAAWRDHMVADIKMLLECDAIYMMEGWERSVGARIEHTIASATGMLVLFQETFRRQQQMTVDSINVQQ